MMSLRNVIVSAITPVASVINCFVRSCAKSNDLLRRGSSSVTSAERKETGAELLLRAEERSLLKGAGPEIVNSNCHLVDELAHVFERFAHLGALLRHALSFHLLR